MDEHINISKLFLEYCKTEFNNDPKNIISRNAIVSIGSMISTTDSKVLNKIDHIFLNTIRKKETKATNQGRTGRCWMFAGLNIFRHNIIHALHLDNFEFSQTYLFFWDKLERANTYMCWFIDNPGIDPTSREFEYMADGFISDGGWWNMFSNLVNKYGLIPKSAMRETWQSVDSEDMNNVLSDYINSTVNVMYENRKKLNKQEMIVLKQLCLTKIYNILVMYLGEPPSEIKWSYLNEENVPHVLEKLSPETFTKATLPSIDLDDFVVLSNIPYGLQENKMYEILLSSNITNGKNFTFLNLHINELIKYTTKSVLAGLPVWFAADIDRDFNFYHSTLDNKLANQEHIFGKKYNFDKKSKILFRQLNSNHAMTFVGLNISDKNIVTNFQVENSWGYFNNDNLGEDGFLNMSLEWFKENVLQVVIHKNFLSRNILKLTKQNTIKLQPWESVAPSLKISSRGIPRQYKRIYQMKTGKYF
jgi:bleomycin hydrolase